MRGFRIAVVGGAVTVSRRAAIGCHDTAVGCAGTQGRQAGGQAQGSDRCHRRCCYGGQDRRAGVGL